MLIPLLVLMGRVLLFNIVELEGLLLLTFFYVSISTLFCYFLVLYLSIKFLVKLFPILGPFYLLRLFFAYSFDFICLRFKILFVMLFDFIVSYLLFYQFSLYKLIESFLDAFFCWITFVKDNFVFIFVLVTGVIFLEKFNVTGCQI